MGEARKFFHLINQNENQKARYLLRLIDRFEQEEGVERAVAREMLVAMVNKELIPHFDAQERFKSTGHPGRLRWLENLLKTPGARTMMDRAAAEVREQQRKDALEKCRRRQENRPLCEFEWMDPETGIRFYEDDIEGSVRIPKEAPPRPSATAVWNVLSKEWK
ncbi:hypothetical protein [Bacteroides heparinolyticus]|uniref:hypothetical protein n=1 Tax=Prevotella heparinolytica TaxID=28113 RepID=UPI0035A0ED45